MTLIALVDSSQQERKALADYAAIYLKQADIPYIIHEFDGGVEFIRSRAVYDIVFMDTELNDMDGLEAARFLRIVNEDAKLIFVAHTAERAICGYEVCALGFVLKPVDQATVARELAKAMKYIEKDYGSCHVLKTPDGIINLPMRSICYVEIYGRNLVYHTERGDYKVRGRLCDVREQLNDSFFVQCSRSYLVNMRHVQSLHNDYLVVKDVEIPIAKAHYKKIRQFFVNGLGGQP